MASYAYLRRIDGKLYDQDGRQYDESGRPFLRRSPEAEARIKQMAEEAKRRSAVQVFANQADRERVKRVEDRSEKINSLREAGFHLKCRRLFYEKILQSDWFSATLARIDHQITKLIRYRNHLLDRLCIAEDMIIEIDRSYLDVQDEIDRLTKLQHAEEVEARKGKSNGQPKTDSSEKRAQAIIASLDPELVAKWRASGLDVEAIARQFVEAKA